VAGITCTGCGIEKTKKYFVGKSTLCTLCTSSGVLPKVVEKIVDEPPEAPPLQFPTVELNYNDPSAKEIAARTLARRRLIQFIKRFKPKYMPGWVHEDIARRLERFMLAVERGEEPRLLMMLPPRAGKQLADDTLVPTPTGWTTHGELRVGSEVFHPSGNVSKVLAVSDKTSSDVRVVFSDGSEFFCHENHEWHLFDRAAQEWKDIPAREFLRLTRFGVAQKLRSGTRARYQLPVVGALQYVGEEYSIHPYALGAWLGDGSAGKPCITGAPSDVAIIAKIESLGYAVSTICIHKTTGCHTTYFSGDGITDVGLSRKRVGSRPGRMSQELLALGIFKNKRIPAEYQYLTVPMRLELLAGLVDTDGTTDENSRVVITTVSELLAKDIMQLCEGLGFRPYMRSVEPCLSSSGIQGHKVVYLVGFQPTMELPVVLERKRIKRFASQRRIGLVSVERLQRGKTGHCVCVDNPDGLYVVGEKLTTTHNSELGSRNFVPWVLGHHPDWEIIAASHTNSLTMSFSRYIRDLLRDPSYHALFPNTVLDPSSQSVENWNLTAGGGYLAAGVGTGITGRGAHILLLDDLVKDIEAADSQTQRDNTWEWYASTAYTRLAPGGGVLGIMTWWSEDDWAGRIQQVMQTGEGDKFEIVRYPAINDEGDEYILADDSITQIPDGIEVPPGARLTRPKGTAIHPERYSTAAMLRIMANLVAAGQKRIWSALYQQNPTPDEGLHFTKKMFREYSHVPQFYGAQIYQAWDFAITEGTQNDWTVGITVLHDSSDDIFILDVNRFRSGDGEEIMSVVVDYAIEWNVDTVGFEDGQIWKSLNSTFTRVCLEKKTYPSYEILKPLTDKLVRAQPLRGRMQAGKIHFPKTAEWLTTLKNELLKFPGGKNDDQVDALAWVVRLILMKSPPRIVTPPPMKSWKDKLKGMMAGKNTGSHMSS
jgi:predicted phage terminase large subunit-like protein